MKVCNKCKIEKDESEFYLSKVVKCGLMARCKSCITAETKDRRAKDPKKYIEDHKRWYKNNKTKYAESAKKWRSKNPDRQKELHDRWVEKHRDRTKIYSKTYWEKNKEKFTEKHKVYRKKDLPNQLIRQQREREILHDRYLIKILVYQEGIPLEAVKDNTILVDLKRLEIQNKREIKKQTNDNKD